MTPWQPEIGQPADAKIARLGDDLGACPVLASAQNRTFEGAFR
jgi:hypothetical protein